MNNRVNSPGVEYEGFETGIPSFPGFASVVSSQSEVTLLSFGGVNFFARRARYPRWPTRKGTSSFPSTMRATTPSSTSKTFCTGGAFAEACCLTAAS